MSRTPRGTVRVLAPCKINPTLVVIERRADGFHELDLSFLALDHCDELRFFPKGAAPTSGRIVVEGPAATDDVPRDATNLAWRAAAAVLSWPPPSDDDSLNAADAAAWRIELHKRVPSRAGLGGGSSDAAAAACAALIATGRGLEDPRVSALLAELGSDCTFFHAARDSGHARGLGRGERIVPAPTPKPPWVAAVITPSIGASTAAVYASLAQSNLGPAAPRRERGARAWDAWLAARDLSEARAALCNDLEAAALRAVPELARWREMLDRRGAAHARLAGSGSSFFGLFGDPATAHAALADWRRGAADSGLGAVCGFVASAAGHGVKLLPGGA